MTDSLFDIFIYDNVIELIPKEKIEDNHVYDITFNEIYSKARDKKIDTETVSICTKIDPLYCSIEAVLSIVGAYDIPEELILYNIREASNFAEYVKINSVKYKFEQDKVLISVRKQTPFEVSEYVKYKASYTCLLREYIGRSNELGIEGKLGDAAFKNADSLRGMKDLLNELKALVYEWEMYLRGYGFEGRAKMQTAVKSSKANPTRSQLKSNYKREVFTDPYNRR